MKNTGYILAAAGLAILFGCGQTQKPAAATVNMGNLTAGKHAYIAVFEKDTAKLNLEIDQFGKVTGKLNIAYGELKPDATELVINRGEVTNGEFKGDTLIANYNFTSGSDKDMYTNPLALLHKDDTLIMGAGKIGNYLGRTYFEPGTLEYKKARFKFVPVR